MVVVMMTHDDTKKRYDEGQESYGEDTQDKVYEYDNGDDGNNDNNNENDEDDYGNTIISQEE